MDYLAPTSSELLHKTCNGELMQDWQIRLEHITKFGFAVLDAKTVASLREYGPFVEVGAGLGYWSWCLNLDGTASIPTDPCHRGEGKYPFKNSQRWMPIEKLSGVEAVAKYPNQSLLMVWPCCDSPWAYETVKAYKGNTVVYVGERKYGCTATDEFHDYMGNEEMWNLVEVLHIPVFYGIYDRVSVYQRV